jgi:hypothetical protein
MGVEDLLGCYNNLEEIKQGILDADQKYGNIIVNKGSFHEAKNIGTLEGLANIRVDVRSTAE